MRIGRTLNVALMDIESARSKRERPANPDSFDLILRARSIWSDPMGPREEAEKLALFEQALQLDPTSIGAMTGIAYSLIESNRHGDDLERAARLLADAAAINPDDELVLGTTGSLLRQQRRCTASISAFQRVLNGNPNSHWAYHEIGACLTALGRAEEAIPMIERANRPNRAFARKHFLKLLAAAARARVVRAGVTKRGRRSAPPPRVQQSAIAGLSFRPREWRQSERMGGRIVKPAILFLVLVEQRRRISRLHRLL